MLSIKQKCKYSMTTKIIYQFLFTFTGFCFTHLLTILFMFSKTFDSFFGINKFVVDRNLKTINCSKIYTFPSYFASDDTVRKIHKLMDKLTQAFRNMPNYPFLNTRTTENLSCWFSISDFKKKKKIITNFGCPYVHVSMLSWDRKI